MGESGRKGESEKYFESYVGLFLKGIQISFRVLSLVH
jgi:hypothetical protein